MASTKNQPLFIPVIYGSVRTARRGIRAARFWVNEVEKRGHESVLVDPKEKKFALPLLDKMYKEYPKGKAPENMERIGKIMRRADAYLIVSAEYNHSIPPALSNTLDHYLEEYFFKPAGIITYSVGSFGGVRAAVHLRAMLGEMGMLTISNMFAIPKVQEAFDEDGKPSDAKYFDRSKNFLEELEWVARALKAAREKGTPY
ncbi:MAG: NADPH-dependent FMN reductase [Candidatus Diapherotrites archaeon]|nr:NADPH-dependent FMN reductase [Candidatus Diapherotrites archaeon]MDZ4256027.1 NADPH-dependent FMN reductase [archaeon]